MTLAGQAPINEIEQTYYLGVFDPRGQLPPQVYRIRVHGQSSFGAGKFASGWVPAQVIDTLSTSALSSSGSSDLGFGSETGSTFLKGRKLVAFGPEGFREVPESHRLVMVMGNNSDKFFNAVSEALGSISTTTIQKRAITLNSEIFKELTELLREKQRMEDFKDDLAGDTP